MRKNLYIRDLQYLSKLAKRQEPPLPATPGEWFAWALLAILMTACVVLIWR